MTPDPRPTYPRTPAYGEGYRSGGEGPRRGVTRAGPVGTTPPPPAQPPRLWPALLLTLAVNLLTLVGVLVLHWPAGNVFLLFWCENVVLGLITLVRIGSAEESSSPRLRTALFFCAHYGIFCLVHLGFTAFVALRLGTNLSFVYLGLPVVLIVVRYAVELVTTWFGPDGLRQRTSPRQAVTAPYPRMIILHVGVLAAFALVLTGLVSGLPDSPLGGFARALAALPSWLGRPEVLAVVVLVLKTVVDLVTTRRALRIP